KIKKDDLTHLTSYNFNEDDLSFNSKEIRIFNYSQFMDPNILNRKIHKA
ncbi:18709_t:CDS:1, partial [Gigaspora margarita]